MRQGSGKNSWMQVKMVSVGGQEYTDAHVLIDPTNSLVWIEGTGAFPMMELAYILVDDVRAAVDRYVMPQAKASKIEEVVDQVWDAICIQMDGRSPEGVDGHAFTASEAEAWAVSHEPEFSANSANVRKALSVLDSRGRITKKALMTKGGKPYRTPRYVAVYSQIEAYLQVDDDDD